MTPEKLNEKLAAAGCVMTSAGAIAVDSQRLMCAFLEALHEIERLETATREPIVFTTDSDPPLRCTVKGPADILVEKVQP